MNQGQSLQQQQQSSNNDNGSTSQQCLPFHLLSIDTAIIPLSDDNSDSAPKTKHSKQPRFEVSSVLLCTDCHCSPASCRTCNHECQHLVSGSSTQTHDKKRRWSFGKGSELSVKIRLLLALEANPHPNPTRREINIMRAPGKTSGLTLILRNYMICDKDTRICQSSSPAGGSGAAAGPAGACSVSGPLRPIGTRLRLPSITGRSNLARL